MAFRRQSLGASDVTWGDILSAVSGPTQDPLVLVPGIGPLIGYSELSDITAANQQISADTGATAGSAGTGGALGLSSATWIAVGLAAVLGLVIVVRR